MKKMLEYVGAAFLAKGLGISQQNVSLAGKRALKADYRGDFLIPNAVLDGGRPLWLKEKAVEFIAKRGLTNDA